MAEPLNIVVPIKGLRDGKSRLAGALSDDERVSLNTYLSERTLSCIEEAQPDAARWVVSPDRSIRALCSRFGFEFFPQTGDGLNAGLSAIAGAVVPARTVYISADLPTLTTGDIDTLAHTPGIVIAPDEKGHGTNALSLPAPETIAFRFGADSFEAHQSEASLTGLPVEITRLPGLMFDLDTKDDLSRLEGWP